jgi:ethanolamine ammonia-lyase small subunit
MDRLDSTENRSDSAKHFAASTPARVGIARAGSRPATKDWLLFRHDHAQARDAVHAEMSEQFLNHFAAAQKLPVIQSTAESRADYILFPPKGKKAGDDVIAELVRVCPRGHTRNTVQIVVSDGLSARAVEVNAPDVVAMLERGFKLEGISSGLPVVVKFGRVAIGDQIAHALGANVVINLIGERPGLSSATSMSAYITYNPGPHTISSDRTVVSNIHDGGTPAVEAGAYIVKLVKTILKAKASGVKLQQM